MMDLFKDFPMLKWTLLWLLFIAFTCLAMVFEYWTYAALSFAGASYFLGRGHESSKMTKELNDIISKYNRLAIKKNANGSN